MSTIHLAFDVESGSISPKNGDLLTAYFVFLDENFKTLDELELKMKPDNGRLPIAEAGALKVNGINIQEHLANPETITYSEAKVKLVALIKKHLKKHGRYSNIRPLGQNINFDIGWVQEYLLPKDEWDTMIHYAIIDTKALVDFFKDCQYFPKDLGSLGSVVDYLQIPKRQAHDAKGDTLMAVDVYLKLIEMMKARKDGGGQSQDLISLLEAE